MLREEEIPPAIRQAEEAGVYSAPGTTLALSTWRLLRSIRRGEQAAHYARLREEQLAQLAEWHAVPDAAPRSPSLLHQSAHGLAS